MLIESLKKAIDKEIGEGTFDKIFNEINHSENIDNLWVDKLYKLSKDDRLKIVKSIVAKYDSQKYIDKEYKCGREPEEYLYNHILKYAEKYGIRLPITSEHEYYPCEAYLVDNNFIVYGVYGHYICVIVKFIE